MCQNCGASQGPFNRIVLAMTPGTTTIPAKSQIVLTVCGGPRDQQAVRARECNARRSKREEE